MGFFDKLFGPGKDLDVLDDSISCLRLGIFSYLFKKNYLPVFGDEKAKFWAAAVLNTIILEAPGNDEAMVFYKKTKRRYYKKHSMSAKTMSLPLQSHICTLLRQYIWLLQQRTLFRRGLRN